MADGLNGNKWKIFLDISAILYYHKNDQNGVTGSSKISKKLLKNMPGKPFLRYVRMLRKMPGAMMKGAMNMKRILSLISTALLLVIVFAVPVSAVVYTERITYEFRENFFEDVHNEHPDGNGTVLFSYVSGINSADVQMFMREGCTTGRTFISMYCNNCEIRTASSHDINNQYISCGTGLTSPYTTKTNHYAIREYNGVTTGWDYYHTSIEHDMSYCDAPRSAD